MHLNLTQNLKLSQELRLTPMMIQSMEILQLQVMQLQARINQELQENPVLELTEESPETLTPQLESSSETIESPPESDYEKLESLENNLNDFESTATRSLKPNTEGTEAKHEALQNTAAPEISLQDYLASQLNMMKLLPRDLEIAEAIVFNLGSDGYLRSTSDDLQLLLEEEMENPPTLEEINEVITFIQNNCDPLGVAARDLQECLLIQIKEIGDRPPLVELIVKDHLDDLLNNRLPHLAKTLNVDLQDVKIAKDFLQMLNPKPGLLFGPSQNSRIIPDVIIEEEDDGSFRVRLENSVVPEIRISGEYRQMLEKKDADSDTLGYVKNKIDSARWLIDAIHQRQMTILKITREIIQVQQDFLREGIEHLKPLRMQEIADAVGVHVSTVSRAISGKYIQCPQGIFLMKKFFTGGSSNEDGSTESHQVVRNRVRELINQEDKKKPYSDDDIVRCLKESGITLARRTVAKYRKLMSIPSARLRKEY